LFDYVLLPCFYLLFMPVAAFMSDLLKQLGPQPFSRWAYPLSLTIVAAATLNPGLYGLYILAATTLDLCSKAGLLEASSSSSSSAMSQALPKASAASAAASGMPGDRALQQQQQLTELYVNFLPRVVPSCELLSEEGQTAALELLLGRAALPLLPSDEKVLPLCMALRLGVRHSEAAAVAVSALESWEQQQPQQLQALLPLVVPLLNPYLQDLSAVQPAEDAVEGAGFEPGTSAANDNQDDRRARGGSAGGSSSSTARGGSGVEQGSGSAAADQARLYRSERRQALAERKSKGAARQVRLPACKCDAHVPSACHNRAAHALIAPNAALWYVLCW
jgi:hypothetical protein